MKKIELFSIITHNLVKVSTKTDKFDWVAIKSYNVPYNATMFHGVPITDFRK
mgnify:CR=1 FL=1